MADMDGCYLYPKEGDAPFVQLVGPDTPERGVVVGQELRSVTTRYPGNSRPSRQIMGTTEKPITLVGWLRDVWAGSAGHAEAQRAALRKLLLSAAYTELSWEGVTRRGYLVGADFEEHNQGAIRYTLTFEVDEADEAEVVAVPYPAAETPFDLLTLINEIEDVLEIFAAELALMSTIEHVIARDA